MKCLRDKKVDFFWVPSSMSSINVKTRTMMNKWSSPNRFPPYIRSRKELSLFHGKIVSEIKIVEMVFRKHCQKLVFFCKAIEDVL